jgi:alkylated DNA nucleotide flippase Atl1
MGKLLRSTDGKLPWWRVVRADRTLAEPVATNQKRRLLAEGVRVQGTRVASAHVLPIGDKRLLKALRRGR